VLLKTDKKGNSYQISLFDSDPQSGRPDVLIDGSLKLPVSEFSDTVDDTALKILDKIAHHFPPKPMRELTQIDLVRVKLSEYESLDGYWTLTVMPSYSTAGVYFNISPAGTSGMNSYEKYFNHSGADMEVDGTYHIQQWTFGLGGNAGMGWWSENASGGTSTFTDFSFRALAAYGLFGSFLIVGLQASSYNAFVNMNYTISGTSNSIAAPDIYLQEINIGVYLQLNISKDFNVSFSGGFPPFNAPFFNDMKFDFTQNGKFSNNKYVVLDSTTAFKNGNFSPLVAFKVNFRIAGGWWLLLYYENTAPGYFSYQNQSISIDASGQTLNKFTYTKTRTGLGVKYDF
jgi:hypothetical protein